MVVYSVNEIAALEKVEKPISAVHDMPTQEPSQEILDLLRELVNKSGKELDATQKEEFYHLLLEFREIFAATSAELGCTDKFKHNIYTGKAPLVRQQVCCIPPSCRSETGGPGHVAEKGDTRVFQPLGLSDSAGKEKKMVLRGFA